MTIESHFYDTKPGEGINEVEWAQAAESRRTLYGVAKANELLCTPHPSTPYAVNLSPAPSGFWGQGVWDTSDAIETIVCPTPGNGVRRFDLIVGHRDWTPTGGGPTTLTYVTGSAARAIPAGRKNIPGEIDDQPLYLLEWLGGQTQPQSITDLRLVGGLEAANALVLDYMREPGCPVKLANAIWYYEKVDSNGNWAHRSYTGIRVDGVPAGRTPIIKTGNVQVSTNAAGDAYYNFPEPFPTAMVSFVVNDSTDPRYWQPLILKDLFIYSDKSRFGVRVYGLAGNEIKAKTGLFVSYTAVGY